MTTTKHSDSRAWHESVRTEKSQSRGDPLCLRHTGYHRSGIPAPAQVRAMLDSRDKASTSTHVSTAQARARVKGDVAVNFFVDKTPAGRKVESGEIVVDD